MQGPSNKNGGKLNVYLYWGGEGRMDGSIGRRIRKGLI